MHSPVRRAVGAALLAVLVLFPVGVMAKGATVKTHSLPAAASGASPRVVSFGVKGGNMMPWSVSIALDGTITASRPNGARQQLGDPQHALVGLLALADAEGFFSLKKTIGCLGPGASNPDVGSRFISFHTAQGTKRVSSFGSCAATSKFDALYAVLENATGVGM